jgi:hypothetical protein
MNSEIRELTVDELEAASGGMRMTVMDAVNYGIMLGFIEAGGQVVCTRTPSGADCTFKP